jgi:hypothetical protein
MFIYSCGKEERSKHFVLSLIPPVNASYPNVMDLMVSPKILVKEITSNVAIFGDGTLESN